MPLPMLLLAAVTSCSGTRGGHGGAGVATASAQQPTAAGPATPQRRPRPTGPVPPCQRLPEVPAFPGAEGFGARSRGGRCGRVVHVTNTDASGPGSFQEALSAHGPRYIVFDVSGVIDSFMAAEQGSVTVAGQTSPGGITVRGYRINEESLEVGGNNDDLIVRHIRSRPDGNGFDDAFRVSHGSRIIVDHCSFGRASDEEVDVSRVQDLTIQNCVLSETIGEHVQYGGMLINYSDPPRWPLNRLAIHHNAWIRIWGRVPEISRESDAAGRTTLDVELSSNLVWAPRIGAWVKARTETRNDQPIYYRMNWVDNFLWAGSYRGFMMSDQILQSDRSQLFFSGNRMSCFPDWSDFQLVYCCDDLGSAGPATQRPTGRVRRQRHPFPAITYTEAQQMPRYALANIGAFPRDAMDQRLFGLVRAGRVDSTPYDRAPADDARRLAYMPGPAPRPPVDTDRDGMPDDWERAHGLDPNREDHNGTTVCRQVLGYDGYTNLEVYLNELADRRVREGR